MKIGFDARIAICTVELVLLVFLSASSAYVVFNHTRFLDLAGALAIVNASAAIWLGLGLMHFSEPWIHEAMIPVG